MEKLLLTKSEALELAGGHLTAWQMNTDLIKREGFPIVRIGRRVYIHRQRFIEWWEEEIKRQMKSKIAT
jgi:hypothetical protein